MMANKITEITRLYNIMHRAINYIRYTLYKHASTTGTTGMNYGNPIWVS